MFLVSAWNVASSRPKMLKSPSSTRFSRPVDRIVEIDVALGLVGEQLGGQVHLLDPLRIVLLAFAVVDVDGAQIELRPAGLEAQQMNGVRAICATSSVAALLGSTSSPAIGEVDAGAVEQEREPLAIAAVGETDVGVDVVPVAAEQPHHPLQRDKVLSHLLHRAPDRTG